MPGKTSFFCKTVILSFVTFHFCIAQTVVPPRPSGPVADFAALIDTDTELIINTVARKLWLEAGFGLLVVTVDSIGSVPVAKFMRELCREWHVWKKDNPEGAVILVIAQPLQCLITTGAGSDSYLTENMLAGMMHSLNDSLAQAGSVAERLVTVINKISGSVSRSKQLSSGKVPSLVVPEKTDEVPTGNRFPGILIIGIAVIAAVIAAVIGGIIAVIVMARTKGAVRSQKQLPFGDVFSGGGFGGGILRREPGTGE